MDSDKLLKALELTPDATLKELAAEFDCWPHAVHRRLKKLKMTRKKTTLYLERNLDKRQAFAEILETLDPATDESGIEASLQREHSGFT